MDDDAQTGANLRLTGEIDVGTPWFAVAHLTALEVTREGTAWRIRFDAPLAEIRKFAAVDARYASLVALQDNEPGDAHGTLTIVAPAGLAADLSREENAIGTPQEWLQSERFAALVIALDRWTPESVGIVTSE